MTQQAPAAKAAPRVRISAKKLIKLKPRTLIHGEPGVGKSTFAANAPGVVFLCAEQGTNNISVARARIEDSSVAEGERDPKTYLETLLVLDSLVAGVAADPSKPPFENLAIDTVDALESFVHHHVCHVSNKRSMADFGFQKGHDLALDCFRLMITRLERLKDYGIGIVLIAHTETKHFNNPEGQDFDFYDIKLHKKISGLLVEWCDNVLFARREQYALEEHGKVRGVSSGARFVHTQKSPAFVAKNRYDLPEKIPLSWTDYQNSLDSHKQADPAELRAHAEAVIAQLDEKTRIQALAALSKIVNDDARMLVQFVDYCRAQLNLQTPEEQKPQELTK